MDVQSIGNFYPISVCVPFQERTTVALDFFYQLLCHLCLSEFDGRVIRRRNSFQEASKSNISGVARDRSSLSKEHVIRPRAFDYGEIARISIFVHGVKILSQFDPLFEIYCLDVSGIGEGDKFDRDTITLQRIIYFNSFP